MSFSPGARLGPYEILSAIGAGGMGEVYRARDTKLDRDVALKVLPAAVANDPERLARFEREAKTLASLNHPNIAHIFGLEGQVGRVGQGGQAGESACIVMELVEGEDLSQRIARGAIPVDEALAIARQIAEALEAAHEQGIIHRDLKPANIKVRPDGTVKVLDFGLAKAMDVGRGFSPAGGPEGPPYNSPSISPTLTSPAMMTGVGTILGTAAYMSPEQAKGRPADKRCDIWAFGCVLFEMLSGKRAFDPSAGSGSSRAQSRDDGEHVFDTLAVVLRGEPEWAVLPAGLPVPIVTLIKRCLAKDRKVRIGDIAVVQYILGDPATVAAGAANVASSAISTPQSRWRVVLPWTIAVAALAAAGVVVSLWAPWRTPVPAQPVRFLVAPSGTLELAIGSPNRDLALSPDGTHLVYAVGLNAQNNELWVRAADRLDAVQLRGISQASHSPAFSPDGQWIAFAVGAELQKVPVTGGAPIVLATTKMIGASGLRGLSWGDNGTIVFATNDPATGLFSVPAGGGEPKVLTTPNHDQNEADHVSPSVLPGGRAVLFTITTNTIGNVNAASNVAVFDLQTGRTKTIVRGGQQPEFIPSGYLLYAAGGSLRAVRFDPVKLEVLSDPVPVLENVTTKSSGAAEFAVSRTGALAYIAGTTATGGPPRALVWVDRRGHEEPIGAPIRSYQRAAISPDGTRLALDIRDQENDIWTWDLAHQTLTRLTFDPGQDSYPVWTADGRRIIFSSTMAGPAPGLYWQAADGSGAPERLAGGESAVSPFSITPDGSGLLFRRTQQSADVMLLHLDAKRAIEPLLQTSFEENNGIVSPDGRWLAYDSDDSGKFEVYVRPYPKVNDGHWQISTRGGRAPLWAPNGHELFFLDGENKLTVVPVLPASGSAFNFGSATRLLDTAYFTPTPTRAYDISRDGQKFVFVKNAGPASSSAAPAQGRITVVLNWQEELKQRLPSR